MVAEFQHDLLVGEQEDILQSVRADGFPRREHIQFGRIQPGACPAPFLEGRDRHQRGVRQTLHVLEVPCRDA